MTSVRRGVILPVVLLVLILLGLLGAMFAFRVNADLASTRAVADSMAVSGEKRPESGFGDLIRR